MTLGLALIEKKKEGCFSVGTQVGCERRVDLTFPKHVLYPWVAPSSGAGAGKIERLVCVFLVQVELWGSEPTCCGVVVCHISLRPGDRRPVACQPPPSSLFMALQPGVCVRKCHLI